jgi:hypothetical protein
MAIRLYFVLTASPATEEVAQKKEKMQQQREFIT